MRILFIGGGNMAAALIGGLTERGFPGSDIDVIEIAAPRRQQLQQCFGVRCDERVGSRQLTATGRIGAEVVVLAVKPQQMRDAATALSSLLEGQLVLSVAAGVRSDDLRRWLGPNCRIVRTMPNTPALIGRGTTGIAASAALRPDDRQRAETIMSAVGEVVWIDDERLLDAVTAVSGSGPAYVFLLIESLIDAARQLGLPPDQARRLALGTVAGAAELAARSDEPPSVLRERVTSPGGTTAAALAVLMQRGLPQLVADAVQAACRRGAELGDEFGAAADGAEAAHLRRD
ncbi:MAG TPA: pyrroline-5-carboxylate reductase [Burkholderiaceae bacterium]|nr:pyrroline-5-carboxylate reductase [Burkholderiaceae bacterium]